MTSYDDNGFRCDGGGGESGQAGCQLQCYINYEPVSVGTFWVVAVSIRTSLDYAHRDLYNIAYII